MDRRYPEPVAAKSKPKLSEQQIARIGRALSEPRRALILKQIGSTEAAFPCSTLQRLHDIRPATLSHHIKQLETADLIAVERDGKFKSFTVRRGVLSAYIDHLAEI